MADLPPPDSANLHQAALTYLARYAATEAGLRRILLKRLDRWARTQPDADATAPILAAGREAIDAIVAKLARAGAVSDAAFAESRTRSLMRAGRSKRAIEARLLAKGVTPGLAREAVGDDPAAELAAALVLARRRRLGPFLTSQPDDPPAAYIKAMGAFARAGFSRDTAERALAMDTTEAERRIHALRADQPLTDDI
jgi:regulatory protein